MYASENKDPALIEPADDDTLWRYQTFGKFQSMVHEEALFFCRLDKFDDPREGTLPSATADAINDFLITPNKDARIQHFNETTRAITAVNCWHLGDYENALMWRSYANPGVAVKTTFASLKDSLRWSPPSVYGGIVQYIDHQTDEIVRTGSMGQGKEWSSFEMATLKRQPFEGEKEFRLISNLLHTVVDGNTGNIIEPKQIDNGIFVGVNLYRLLEEVVISPDADDQWVAKIKALVEQINDRLPRNSKIPVNKSTLYG